MICNTHKMLSSLMIIAQISKIITNRKKQHINTVSAVSIWLLICTSLLRPCLFPLINGFSAVRTPEARKSRQTVCVRRAYLHRGFSMRQPFELRIRNRKSRRESRFSGERGWQNARPTYTVPNRA